MTFKRVLVPVDTSPYAETALAYLPRFVDPTKTELILLSVLETLRYAANAYEYAPTLIGELHQEHESYLQTLGQSLQEHGYHVDSQLVEGDAAEKILEVAEQSQADLIAMTTHGRSGVARLAMGSVAERVIHGATLPVLLVRGQTAMPHNKLQRILVPLDGSSLAEQALPHAQRLAKETGAELRLLQVIAEADVEYKFDRVSADERFDRMYDSAVKHAGAYLKSVALHIQSAGVACQTTVLCGDPAILTCALANESVIDLVVISTHGRTGFKRWVYGSVANQVIRAVTCPVLVIRGAQPGPAKG